MTRPLKFEVQRGVHEPNEPAADRARASYETRRAAVLSYEQLVAAQGQVPRAARPFAVMPARERRDLAEEVAREITAERLARDPLAHPVAPPRPRGAARPMYVASLEASGHQAEASRAAGRKVGPKDDFPAIEPVEPNAEPRPGGSAHTGTQVPGRSRLSPSQRAALKRPE